MKWTMTNHVNAVNVGSYLYKRQYHPETLKTLIKNKLSNKLKTYQKSDIQKLCVKISPLPSYARKNISCRPFKNVHDHIWHIPLIT